MSYTFHPVCGCINCTEPKVAEVEIPGKGKRAVCEDHLEDVKVNGGVVQ